MQESDGRNRIVEADLVDLESQWRKHCVLGVHVVSAEQRISYVASQHLHLPLLRNHQSLSSCLRAELQHPQKPPVQSAPEPDPADSKDCSHREKRQTTQASRNAAAGRMNTDQAAAAPDGPSTRQADKMAAAKQQPDNCGIAGAAADVAGWQKVAKVYTHMDKVAVPACDGPKAMRVL